jgi:hypothetical protein
MKELLQQQGYKPQDWLYTKNLHNELHIVHKQLGRVEIIERKGHNTSEPIVQRVSVNRSEPSFMRVPLYMSEPL